LVTFAYPIERYNPVAALDRKKRRHAAPKAVFELDINGLIERDLWDRCEICSGHEPLWSDMDQGNTPRLRFCKHCAKDFDIIKGISVGAPEAIYPLATNVKVSGCALLVAAFIHLPEPLYVVLGMLVCGTAMACFAFRSSRISRSGSKMAEVEFLVWVAVVFIFFLRPPFAFFTWRVIDGLTAGAFVIAGAATETKLYGDFISARNELSQTEIVDLQTIE
jgi:hypothetical protein